MGDEDEPPDGRNHGKTSGLVKTVEHDDDDGILSIPNRTQGIIGYCNPSIIPSYVKGKGYPIFVRTRFADNNRYGESSKIKAGYMHSPTEIGELRTIIGKNAPYANWGTEDLRGVMGPDGNIHMAAISFDGKNARIAYYIASTDLRDVQYIGTISPKITLEKAQKFFKRGSIYHKAIGQALEEAKRNRKRGMLLQNKDASPYFHGRGMKLFGRIEPCIQTHTLRKDDSNINPNPLTTHEIIKAVREAGRIDYWENELLNLEARTIMTPEASQIKIGLGGAPIKMTGIDDGTEVGTMHSVFRSRREFGGRKVDYYLYLGSLFNYDPVHDRVTAKLRDALIIPSTKGDRLKEYDKQGNLVTVKDIAFSSALISDPNSPQTAFIYGGGGDRCTRWRSFGLEWYREATNHPHNRQHIKDLIDAA